MKYLKLLRSAAGLVFCSMMATPIAWSQAAAQPNSPLGIVLEPATAGDQPVAGALRIVALLTLLALLPAVVIAMTSFTRTIIVLSMLRHAFGMQDTPPNMVLVSLALFLTIFTMSPAIQQINERGLQPLERGEVSMQAAIVAGIQPLREFMIRQTREKDLELILDVARVPVPRASSRLAPRSSSPPSC